MRITLIIPFSIERPSGIRYFGIASALARRGHQLRILALHHDYANCTRRRFVQQGVEIWYLGQMHALKRGSEALRFGPLALLLVLLRATLGLIWGILCSPADIYHLGKPQPVNGLAALIGVQLLRRRTFYLDCDDDETTSNRFSAGWQRAVFAFWQWLIPRLARGVTVNTLFLQERMARANIQPVVYVPNGFDPARFSQPPAAVLAGLRSALGLDGQQVIAYLGSLALQNHPVDLLLEAFATLASEVQNCTLVLIGGGEDLALLQARAVALGLAGRVRFSGALPQRTAAAVLALATLSADPVYDNPVARARSPLKLFESMALGVPPVTASVGDRALLLAAGRAGVLVAPGSASALAEGLRAVLQDEAYHQRLVAGARLQVQGYRWDVLAARWQAVYH